ncbi:MAG: ABC transporter permease [Acidimicrobiia bacterium]|nr:ABC transporter permease [Acidimicrobiia bacterium]
MSDWRTLLLVARRDFVERLKSRAFQISTALTVVLVLAAVILPQLFADGPNEWNVGVVDVEAVQLEATMTALQGDSDPIGVNVRSVDSRETLVRLLEAGEVDVGVVKGEGVITGDGTSRALGTLAAAALTAVELTDRAEQLGLTPQQVAGLLGLEQAPISSISGEPDADAQGAEALALFATILLFVSIVTYGQWILIGVIEEKSNRVVEVVVGTVPPRILLTGKVLGIGLLGLIQLVLIAIVAFVALRLTGTATLPDTTGAVIVASAFWFLGGFAFYATAYAAAGALVSRQEEAQNAAFPLTLVLMAAYFLATFSLTGDNPVIRIASLLPPFAPMTMPLQIALGRASTIDIVISSVLMIMGVYLLLRVAARIYRGGILRSGGKIRINEAWRSSEG